MDRRYLLTLSGALLVNGLAGCVGSEDENDDSDRAAGTSPDLEDEDLASLVGNTNGFGFDLYRELIDDADGENLLLSPASIAMAFAMTYAGASGDTREQMRDVLRYELDDETVHATFHTLQEELDERGVEDPTDDDEDSQPVELSIANSAWVDDEFSVADSFVDILEDYYGGGLREVDFSTSPGDARREINEWVEDETEDRITDLLPGGAVEELTRLVLVNAVYFMADWEHPFPESDTADETFTSVGGTTEEVPMMKHDEEFQYAEVDEVKAVDLPYVGGDVSMLVMLPPEGEFQAVDREFDGELYTEIVQSLQEQRGAVHLPRFEFESTFELSEPIEALGMTDAFNEETANFDEISDDEISLSIDEAYHETYIAVDEDGTEAAAATATTIDLESEPDFEFVANRPFLFVIRDRPTGTILFYGRAVNSKDWG